MISLPCKSFRSYYYQFLQDRDLTVSSLFFNHIKECPICAEDYEQSLRFEDSLCSIFQFYKDSLEQVFPLCQGSFNKGLMKKLAEAKQADAQETLKAGNRERVRQVRHIPIKVPLAERARLFFRGLSPFQGLSLAVAPLAITAIVVFINPIRTQNTQQETVQKGMMPMAHQTGIKVYKVKGPHKTARRAETILVPTHKMLWNIAQENDAKVVKRRANSAEMQFMEMQWKLLKNRRRDIRLMTDMAVYYKSIGNPFKALELEEDILSSTFLISIAE
mgnify:CR=1 FL=1